MVSLSHLFSYPSWRCLVLGASRKGLKPRQSNQLSSPTQQ